jgi:lysosomal-associated membrane protein 1/2
MIATFAAQFNIPYNQTNKQSVTGYLNVENGEVDPSTKCDWNATSIDLKINFDNNDNMVLSFKDDGTKRWVHQLVLTYTPSNSTIFPGHPAPTVPKTETFTNLTLFIATGEKAYYCIAGEQAVSDTDSVTAKFGNVIVDAFRPQTAPVDYRERQDCANTDVSDLVPIAVGIALLSLVVIVLIAYFIGRRRSRRLAYQSV